MTTPPRKFPQKLMPSLLMAIMQSAFLAALVRVFAGVNSRLSRLHSGIDRENCMLSSVVNGNRLNRVALMGNLDKTFSNLCRLLRYGGQANSRAGPDVVSWTLFSRNP